MASDRGKQQAYCKVCSKHFSVSHGGIDDVRRHGEGKKHLELFNARRSNNQILCNCIHVYCNHFIIDFYFLHISIQMSSKFYIYIFFFIKF